MSGNHLWIVTVKLPKRWAGPHDAGNKRTGSCPFSLTCTDVTGEHHSFLLSGDDEDSVTGHAQKIMELKGFPPHVTRVEKFDEQS